MSFPTSKKPNIFNSIEVKVHLGGKFWPKKGWMCDPYAYLYNLMFILLSCDDWRLLNRIWRRLDLGGIPAGWFFFKSPNQISCFNFSSGSQVVQSRDHDHTLSFYPFSTTTHHNIFPSLESYYFNAWAGANDLPPVFFGIQKS